MKSTGRQARPERERDRHAQDHQEEERAEQDDRRHAGRESCLGHGAIFRFAGGLAGTASIIHAAPGQHVLGGIRDVGGRRRRRAAGQDAKLS